MLGLPHYVLFVRMLKFSRGTVQQYTLGLDFFHFCLLILLCVH